MAFQKLLGIKLVLITADNNLIIKPLLCSTHLKCDKMF